MLANRVGACYARTYGKIADYFEVELLNYRKADKVYRMGLDYLKPESATEGDDSQSEASFGQARRSSQVKQRKEYGSLQSLYERFCERMEKRVEEEAVPQIARLRENSLCEMRTEEEAERVRREHEQLYAN